MEYKESFSNLVLKTFYKNLTFKKLLKTAGTNYNEIEIRDFVLGIKYKEVKEKLIEQAKEYYSDIYDCDKEEVCYGDFIEARKDCSTYNGRFPYSVVIGTVEISNEFKDAKNLKYVAVNLFATGVSDFSNLEGVGNECDLVGTYQKVESETMHVRRKSIKIPNLTCCSKLCLSDCVVDSVNVKKLNYLTIRDARIKILNTTSVAQRLTLLGQIEEAESLEYVCILESTSEEQNGFRYLNPEVDINKIVNNSSHEFGVTAIDEKLEQAMIRSEKRIRQTSTSDDE